MKKKFQDGGKTDRDTRGTKYAHGISAAELLTTATRRKKFDQITEDDIRSLGVKQGFSKRDTNRAVQGFKNFDKNASLELDETGKNFNVFQGTGAAVKSGKQTGNKKGLDAGDLVGLGRNVNYLAGLAGATISDYNKKKEEEAKPKKTETVTTTGTGEGINIGYGDSSSGGGAGGKKKTVVNDTTIPTTVPKRTGGRGGSESGYKSGGRGGATEPSTGSVWGNNKPAKPNMTPISREDYLNNRTRFQELIEDYIDKNERTLTMFHKGNKGKNSRDFDEALARFSDEIDKLPSERSIEDIFDEHAGTYIDNLRYKRKQFGMDSEGDLAVGMATMGLAPAAISAVGKGLAFSKASRLLNWTKGNIRGFGPKLNSLEMANQLTKAGDVPSLTASKILIDPVRKGVQNLFSRQAKNVKFPKIDTPNVVYKGTSPKSKIIKQRSAQMEEGYRKGGKIYAQEGRKFPQFGGLVRSARDSGWLTQSNLGIAPINAKQILDKRIAADRASGTLASYPGAPGEVNRKTRGGGGGNGINPDNVSDALQAANAIGSPLLAYQLLKMKQEKPRTTSPIELGARPEQDSPYTPEVASPTPNQRNMNVDAQSLLAFQKGVDSENRNRRNVYQKENAAQKLATRDRIIETKNKERMINAQRDDQNFNQLQYRNLNRSFANQQLGTDVAKGVFMNVDQLIGEKRANKEARITDYVKEIIKRGNEGSEEYIWAMKHLNSIDPSIKNSISKKHGGKMTASKLMSYK